MLKFLSGKGGKDKDPKPPRKPGLDELKGASVGKAVLSECLSHPASIFPWVGAVLATVWTVAIAATAVSVGAIFGLFAIGTCAFIYNYVIDGERRAAAHMQQLQEAVKAHVHVELEAIAAESRELGFAEGVKEARELATDFGNLMAYLEGKPAVDRFRILAEDTLKEGVRILQQAVAVYRAVISIDVEVLKSEVESWRQERKGLADDNGKAKALDRQIDSHEQRIALYDTRQDTIDELIARVNDIETALQTTYLELVELGNQDPTSLLRDGGGASSRLKSAVESARRVEDRLRGETPEDEAARRMKYIRRSQ